MFNLNDFKEKQIVFIQSQDLNEGIRFRNENLVFEKEGKIANQLSCHKILTVFIMGNTTITSNFIKQAISFGISVFLMNRNFFLYATIEAKAEGNYLLREKQYKNSQADDFLMAKQLIKNKTFNQLALLESVGKINDVKERKKKIWDKIDEVQIEKELLGIEGEMSRRFFSLYFEEADWYRRLPRAKQDETNLLLDMGYTFLFNYIDCLLRLFGFDVYRGFYHKFFFKRKSLSCDVMEPFRCLIDRAILRMYHLKIFNKKDFKYQKCQYILPWQNSRKYNQYFLEEIMKNKVEIYDYVLKFYRHMMDKNKEFPQFKPRFK